MSALARSAAAVVAAVGGLTLASACAPIIGLDEPGSEIDQICACQEFNFAPSLAKQCNDAAALEAHQTPEFLDAFVAASGPDGVSCPDCTHLQECLMRLELDERYIPCDNNDQCAGHRCCTVPGQEHATCCSTCSVCT